MSAKRSRKTNFRSDAEAAEHFDRHSGAAEWKASKPVKMEFRRPIKHMISIRMELELFEKIRRVAEAKGLPYQTMMRQWLLERVEEELPSLRQPYLYGAGLSLGVADR